MPGGEGACLSNVCLLRRLRLHLVKSWFSLKTHRGTKQRTVTMSAGQLSNEPMGAADSCDIFHHVCSSPLLSHYIQISIKCVAVI